MLAELTPEHAAALIQGVSPLQFVTLICVGGIFVLAVIATVRWIVDLKLDSIPQDLHEIKEAQNAIQITQARMSEKLWTKDDLRDEISRAISEHASMCPGHECKK